MKISADDICGDFFFCGLYGIDKYGCCSCVRCVIFYKKRALHTKNAQGCIDNWKNT